MYGTGRAKINVDELIAGSYSNWTIEYEVGEYGIDDSGEILIARRDVSDSDIPQFDDPRLPGFVKVYGDVEAKLRVSYVTDRYIRPFRSCICIKVSDGSLKPGDKIYIQYGANQGEGPGYRIQTFAEEEHLFLVLADCAGSGNYYEIDEIPFVKVIGGYIDMLQAVAPSTIKVDEEFDVLVRALDSWGNVARKHNGKIILKTPDKDIAVDIKEGIARSEKISIKDVGVYSFMLEDEGTKIEGKSNPISCEKDDKMTLFWGDMHGQTKETVGTGTLDGYFSFARDCSGLDFSAWQGNDFQITDETWADVCNKVKKYHKPGSFITFLGYEWSGTTPVGGDYNIYFLNDDQKIHRSYHWQIGMNERDGSERNPIDKLWKEFAGREDVMAIPHVGGRYGNLDYCDEDFVKLIEIHSHHGTFEWFFLDALKKGLKLGVIAASDDHTCRPGLSYPTEKTSRGFVSFDVIGGYTGVYADELTRESLWDAFKKRHTYATTGERIILQVKCCDRMMGDEFETDKIPEIEVSVMGSDLISEIEIFRGLENIYSYSNSLKKRMNTIKIEFSGVRIKSRSKKTNWDGMLTIENGRFEGIERMDFNRAQDRVTLVSNQIIKWNSNTSGNTNGFEIKIDGNKKTKLRFSSSQISFGFDMDDIAENKLIKDAGGINQKVTLSMAKEPAAKNVDIKFTDNKIKQGINAYWVKAVQKDGHTAWSSPIYIEFLKN